MRAEGPVGNLSGVPAGNCPHPPGAWRRVRRSPRRLSGRGREPVSPRSGWPSAPGTAGCRTCALGGQGEGIGHGGVGVRDDGLPGPGSADCWGAPRASASPWAH